MTYKDNLLQDYVRAFYTKDQDNEAISQNAHYCISDKPVIFIFHKARNLLNVVKLFFALHSFKYRFDIKQ